MKLFLILLQGLFCNECNEWVKVFYTWDSYCPISHSTVHICSLWVKWLIGQVSVSSIIKDFLHVLSLRCLHPSSNSMGLKWNWNNDIIIASIFKLNGFEWSLTSTNSIKLSQCKYTLNNNDFPHLQWMKPGTLCCNIATVNTFSQWIKSCVVLFLQWIHSNTFQNEIINPTRSSTDDGHTNMEHLLFVPGTQF